MRVLPILLSLFVVDCWSVGSAQVRSSVIRKIDKLLTSNIRYRPENELFLLAMEQRDLELLQELIPDLKFTDAFANSIAHELVSGSHVELLEFFVAHDIVTADFTIGTGYRGSLLLRATVVRNLPVIKKIVSLKEENNIAEIDLALRTVADQDSSISIEGGPESFARSEARLLAIMDLLVKGGADVNVIGEDQSTPLTRAILAYSAPRVEFLLEQGFVIGDVRYALYKAESRLTSPSLEGYHFLDALQNNLAETKKLLIANGIITEQEARYQIYPTLTKGTI